MQNFAEILNKMNILKDITFSKIIKNTDLLKDKKLVKKLRKLDRPQLAGGFGAVLNYPKENLSDIVIAYYNQEPIGWISVTNGYQNIYVKKDYRKIGIASKLKDIIYKRKT